jgi:hypothetical protein
MVKGKIRIFTEEEETIIHNFNKAKRLKKTEGFDDEMNKCWTDELMVDGNEVYVERNYTTRDGDFWGNEDFTELYLEMEEEKSE